jgi:hypothetical protein
MAKFPGIKWRSFTFRVHHVDSSASNVIMALERRDDNEHDDTWHNDTGYNVTQHDTLNTNYFYIFAEYLYTQQGD